MSDVQRIFSRVRVEARRQAEDRLRALEDGLPMLPTGSGDFYSFAKPRYTDEQRQEFLKNCEQEAVDRLEKFLVDAALGQRNNTNTTVYFNHRIFS